MCVMCVNSIFKIVIALPEKDEWHLQKSPKILINISYFKYFVTILIENFNMKNVSKYRPRRSGIMCMLG